MLGSDVEAGLDHGEEGAGDDDADAEIDGAYPIRSSREEPVDT